MSSLSEYRPQKLWPATLFLLFLAKPKTFWGNLSQNALFCKVSEPVLISPSDQRKPFVRKADISFDFNRNFVYSLLKTDFRNVSEALRTSSLFHSILFHSILLHSTNVSSWSKSNVYKRYSRQRNLICSERWQGSGVLRQVGGNETVVRMRAAKR